jgi:hypothetical protein
MNPFRVLSPLRRYRPRYADVTATLALVLAMGGTAYAATSLGPHTVGTPQLKSHAVTAGKIHSRAVTSSKLEPGAVTRAKLGPDSVAGSNVAANSLSLSDLVGADISGNVGFSISANSCGTLNLGVSGAQVGQLVLFSFTGNTAVPSTVAFGGAKVTAAGTVTVRACNVSTTAFSVTNLGIRIVTFG